MLQTPRTQPACFKGLQNSFQSGRGGPLTSPLGDEVEDVREMVVSRCGEDHVCVFFCFVCLFFCSVLEVFFGPSSSCCFCFSSFRSFFGCATSQSFLMDYFCGMLIGDSRLACIFFQEKVAIDRVKLLKKLGPKRLDDLEGKSAGFFVGCFTPCFFGLLKHDLPKMGGKIWIFVLFFLNLNFGEEGNNTNDFVLQKPWLTWTMKSWLVNEGILILGLMK